MRGGDGRQLQSGTHEVAHEIAGRVLLLLLLLLLLVERVGLQVVCARVSVQIRLLQLLRMKGWRRRLAARHAHVHHCVRQLRELCWLQLRQYGLQACAQLRQACLHALQLLLPCLLPAPMLQWVRAKRRAQVLPLPLHLLLLLLRWLRLRWLRLRQRRLPVLLGIWMGALELRGHQEYGLVGLGAGGSSRRRWVLRSRELLLLVEELQ